MTKSDSRVAVYTGSFDPITLGHLNVIERAARLVDTLIVGIGVNVEKAALFSPVEREELVAAATEHLKNVEVRSFSCLAVEFVRQCGATLVGDFCAIHLSASKWTPTTALSLSDWPGRIRDPPRARRSDALP